MVEAWGDSDQADAVLEALRRQGCETGADALVIVESQSQANPALAKNGLPLSLQEQEFRSDASLAQKHKADIEPRLGERGHPGYYIDSIAIVYEKEKADHVPDH